MNPDPRENKPSASSMERFVNCPGSWQSEQGQPELPKAKVTQDGTDIHEALATGEGDELELTPGEIADKLRRMEGTALEDWANTNKLETFQPRVAEQRLWLRNPRTLELVASAQLDVFYLSPPHALIFLTSRPASRPPPPAS